LVTDRIQEYYVDLGTEFPRDVDIGVLRDDLRPNVMFVVNGAAYQLVDYALDSWSVGLVHVEVLRLDSPCPGGGINFAPGC
jgi:hypothetical protein